MSFICGGLPPRMAWGVFEEGYWEWLLLAKKAKRKTEIRLRLQSPSSSGTTTY